MSKRLYPLGQQYFPEIITDNKVYVDKTMFVHRVVNTGKYFFLSRPRRFGKSLFISTLETLFLGKKEIFKGLYVYDKWEFEPYPIIKISFSNIGYREMGLFQALQIKLNEIAASHGIALTSDQISQMFNELIQKLHSQYQKGVVVLIDEYDKPLIDYLDSGIVSEKFA